eukprot:s3251_g10.t1
MKVSFEILSKPRKFRSPWPWPVQMASEINERLSEHCADELSALHAEVHQGISEIRAQLSKEADRTSVRTMCMEAELEFHHSRQVSPVRTPTEVGMLAHSVLAQRNESDLPSLRQGAGSDVGYLIQACKSLCSSTEGSDEGSGAAMSIATKLGALLEEVDRDCHAMALALDDMDGQSQAEGVGWLRVGWSFCASQRPTERLVICPRLHWPA